MLQTGAAYSVLKHLTDEFIEMPSTDLEQGLEHRTHWPRALERNRLLRDAAEMKGQTCFSSFGNPVVKPSQAP